MNIAVRSSMTALACVVSLAACTSSGHSSASTGSSHSPADAGVSASSEPATGTSSAVTVVVNYSYPTMFPPGSTMLTARHTSARDVAAEVPSQACRVYFLHSTNQGGGVSNEVHLLVTSTTIERDLVDLRRLPGVTAVRRLPADQFGVVQADTWGIYGPVDCRSTTV